MAEIVTYMFADLFTLWFLFYMVWWLANWMMDSGF